MTHKSTSAKIRKETGIQDSLIRLYVGIKKDDPLAHVNYEYNGVGLESTFSEKQLMIGEGAGDKPTGSAVLSDISSLTYNYKYENMKYFHVDKNLKLINHGKYKVYIRFHEKFHGFEDFISIEEKY